MPQKRSTQNWTSRMRLNSLFFNCNYAAFFAYIRHINIVWRILHEKDILLVSVAAGVLMLFWMWKVRRCIWFDE